MVNPAAQSVVVGMAGHARHLGNLGVDRDGFTKELDLLGPFQQVAAKRTFRLVADKEDRTFLPPEIVFEMVADAPGIAHAGSRKDHFWGGVQVDGDRILLGFADPQPGEGQRVLPAAHKRERFRIKTFAEIFTEDRCRFACERAVYIHFKPFVALHPPFGLDLADEVEHFLGSPDRKTRDHNIAAAVKRALQHSRKFTDIVGFRPVGAVAVGGFHHDIVSRIQVMGVAQQRLVEVADIARKHNRLSTPAFGDAQRD